MAIRRRQILGIAAVILVLLLPSCAHDQLERGTDTVSSGTTLKAECGKDKPCQSPGQRTEEEHAVPLYRVWYGTDRQPHGAGFSNRRDHKLRYGQCLVHIPHSHTFGSTGSSFVVRTLTQKDDRVRLRSVALMTEEEFFSDLRKELGSGRSQGRTLLVYIHGYNVSFEEAAIRAAQIGYDLKIDGVTAFFSWPTKGSWWRYAADEATIDVIEDHLKEFLMKLALDSQADALHIISHSMGNRALLRVMDSLSKDPSFVAKKRFGQIVLAAPDVDSDQFRRLARAYTNMAQRTTLYISPMDRALHTSSVIHDYPRAGFFPPIMVLPEIDTVKVERFDLNLLGHDYFASAEPLLYDISQMIKTNSAPDTRPRLKKYFTEERQPYWQID